MKEDFKFNYLNYEETKEEYRNSPILTAELLYNIGWALYALTKRFDSGSVVLFSETCASKDMWDAVNYARLWPESNHPEADHILQEALGHLGDAHYMIEEVYFRTTEGASIKTTTAYVSIINEVRFAMSLIKKAVILIDQYIGSALGGKQRGEK